MHFSIKIKIIVILIFCFLKQFDFAIWIKPFVVYRKLSSFSFLAFRLCIQWLGHYFIKIKCRNKIGFNPFCKYRVREREKSLPYQNQTNVDRSMAVQRMSLKLPVYILGIALLALIDDKFMRFLLSFTIFGVFELQVTLTQLFSIFHG